MDKLVPITEAKARLSELVHDVERGDDVLLVRHGRPTAMLVAVGRYNSLLDEIEDLRDRLSVHEAEGVAIPAEKAWIELDLVDR